MMTADYSKEKERGHYLPSNSAFFLEKGVDSDITRAFFFSFILEGCWGSALACGLRLLY